MLSNITIARLEITDPTVLAAALRSFKSGSLFLFTGVGTVIM